MTALLRVGTLNLWGWNDPWPRRLELIRAELGRLGPQLFGMQEVMRAGSRCQAAEVSDGLGYTVVYGPARHGADGAIQGNALLSTLPVLEEDVYELPGIAGAEPRSVLRALVATPHGNLPVFVTHLNWQGDHGAARLAQIRSIVSLAQAHEADLPPVIMGDFNADPDADEIRYLRGLAIVEDTNVCFADAWLYGGDDTVGATFSRTNGYAVQAREPSRRIDYIFTGGDDKLRGEPLTTTLAFTEAVDGIWPSDHFGLISDIVISPR